MRADKQLLGGIASRRFGRALEFGEHRIGILHAHALQARLSPRRYARAMQSQRGLCGMVYMSISEEERRHRGDA